MDITSAIYRDLSILDFASTHIAAKDVVFVYTALPVEIILGFTGTDPCFNSKFYG